MKSKDILLIVLVFTAFLFSLYRRYLKKKKTSENSEKGLIHSSARDSLKSVEDDYEPYMKK
jgi:hypothetical protein